MKKVIIPLILLILVPAGALWGLYTFNNDARLMANAVLARMPGPVGEFFSSMPTPQDTEDQLVTIASYLLTLDRKQAVDKLNLIENEDGATYQSVVRSMVRLDPTKTEKILEEKRQQSLKSTVIQSTLEQIGQEQTEDVKAQAAVIQSMALPERIKEFQRILTDRIDAYDFLARMAEQMEVSKVAEVLPFLEDQQISGIYAALDDEVGMKIRQYLSDTQSRESSLSSAAQILSGKTNDELVDLLSNETTYPLTELITIYESLGPKRAGQIMSQIDNTAFVNSVVTGIKDKQILNQGSDNFTADLLKSLNIYKSYDDNISELVDIYSALDDSKTADIIKRLYWNSGQVKRYPLKNGDEIVITDQQLALDLLKSFPTKKIASVLSYLDNNISTEISTKLALPNL